jgi:DNA-binding MarR family transcriptional regulator
MEAKVHSTLLDLELGRNAYGQLIRKALNEVGIDAREAVVIRLLAANRETTIWNIRVSTGMPPSTVGSVARRLVDDGLVARFRMTSDRRFVWLELTPMGRVVARMVSSAVRDIDARMRELPLPDTESLSGVASLLHQLTAPRWPDPLS